MTSSGLRMRIPCLFILPLFLVASASALYIQNSTTALPAYGKAEVSFELASTEEITNVTVTIDTELGIVQEEVKTLEVYPDKVKTSEGEEITKSEKIASSISQAALDINNSLHVVPLDSNSNDSTGGRTSSTAAEKESGYSVQTAKQTLNYYSLPFEVIGANSQFASFIKEKQEFRFMLLMKDASDSLKMPVRVKYTQSGKEYEEIFHIGVIIPEPEPAPTPVPASERENSSPDIKMLTIAVLVVISLVLSIVNLRKKR